VKANKRTSIVATIAQSGSVMASSKKRKTTSPVTKAGGKKAARRSKADPVLPRIRLTAEVAAGG
jgi:hypothetical protein